MGHPGTGDGSSLAVLLRTWRERAVLTQEQLALHAGLTARTIRRLEAGEVRHPRGDSLLLLADALRLTDTERTELVAAARATPARAAGPRQLPPDVAAFAGRAEHLRQLDALLDSTAGPPAVVISAIAGTAGVGKTALAVHWAHRVVDRFPDGQLYLNLRGFDPASPPTDPHVAIRRLLDALGVPPARIPADPEAQINLYRSQLAGRRMLVLLDNAHDAVQVRPLLPEAPGCLALVTSRDRLTGLVAADGVYPLALDVLTEREARELLVRRLGAQRVAAEPQAVRELIDRCARLPLALAVVAAQAATRPALALTALAAELRQAGLDAFDTGDPLTDVRAAFSWSYHGLGTEAARLFRLLGLHPGPDLGVAAAASLAGASPQAVRPPLAELARAHLLAEHTPGRYTLHDLLRGYAAEQSRRIDPDGQRRAATHRMLDHYLHSAFAATYLLEPLRDPITVAPAVPGTTLENLTDCEHALAWFGTEHAVLLASIEHAVATGWHTHTWQLAWTLARYLDRRGQWHDQATAQRAAVAAAEHLGHPLAEARARSILGSAYTRLGRPDDAEAQLHRALELSCLSGDPIALAHTSFNLALVLERQGQLVPALQHAGQALEQYEAIGHRYGQAETLNEIGWLHAQLGEYEPALTHCERALTLHRKLDNHQGLAATWDSLGYIRHHQGHHDHAVTCYQQAIELHRDLGDAYYEASTLNCLGDTHRAIGDSGSARRVWQRALQILGEVDHPDATSVRAKLGALDDAPADSP